MTNFNENTVLDPNNNTDADFADFLRSKREEARAKYLTLKVEARRLATMLDSDDVAADWAQMEQTMRNCNATPAQYVTAAYIVVDYWTDVCQEHHNDALGY